MAIYDALRGILLKPQGPLSNLYALRLPTQQTDTDGVDVAYIPLGGLGSERTFGSQALTGAAFRAPGGGAANDGGVAWWHQGAMFEVRGWDEGESAVVACMAGAAQIRDCLVQYAGTPVTVAGTQIVRCEISSGPDYGYQDNLERPVVQVTAEIWYFDGLDRS